MAARMIPSLGPAEYDDRSREGESCAIGARLLMRFGFHPWAPTNLVLLTTLLRLLATLLCARQTLVIQLLK